MRRTLSASIFLFLLLFAAAVFAESISGTVTNVTTGKPASGVTVTLVDPMGGMAEIGSAKADGQGRFKIEAAAAQGPRLVKAEKGGVNYFKMITPGSTSIDLNVYDASASVEGISGSADVVKLQTQGSMLQAIELFAVKNASNPPRALASSATFEFVLPDGAQIDAADAQGPNGQPIAATPNPARNTIGSYTSSPRDGEIKFMNSEFQNVNGPSCSRRVEKARTSSSAENSLATRRAFSSVMVAKKTSLSGAAIARQTLNQNAGSVAMGSLTLAKASALLRIRSRAMRNSSPGPAGESAEGAGFWARRAEDRTAGARAAAHFRRVNFAPREEPVICAPVPPWRL